MVRPRGVPEDANVLYYISSRHRAYIWWWQVNGGWYWVAAGNNGEEKTSRDALDRAKRWIKDGQ